MARVLAIKTCDINNGPGLRVSVWFSGCEFHCKGCHNKSAWDFKQGKEFSSDIIEEVIDLLDGEVKQDLSILGGEPLHPINRKATLELCKEVKKRLPYVSIWLWTGYEYNEVKDLEITNYLDVLIDGKFVEKLHKDELLYKGSSNQNVIKLNN